MPTFTFTPSTQLLHALAYHKARMALVYFQSSHGPHKIQSDKELDIQVWLTPPSFSLLLPADCLNTRFLGVPRLCAVSDHPLYIFVYLCVNCKSLPFFYFLTFEKGSLLYIDPVGWSVGRSTSPLIFSICRGIKALY